MLQLNDFGVAVKRRLIDLNQNQAWLIKKFQEETGQYFDNAYLQKLMTGRSKSAYKVQVIKEILGLED